MITVMKVEITFSESGWFQRRYKGGSAEFASIREADACLIHIASEAGSLGYEKTDFRITFSDGFVYQGRYDIRSLQERQGNPNGCCDLADHIMNFLQVYAGERKPAHMTEAQYTQFMAWSPPGYQMHCKGLICKYGPALLAK